MFLVALGAEFVISGIDWHTLEGHHLRLNPDHVLHVYTDERVRLFLETTYPQYVSLSDRLRYPQWRSDLVRYLLMYTHGGIYMDVGKKPLLSFRDIAEHTGGGDKQDMRESVPNI